MTSADDLNLFSLRNILLLLAVCIAVLIPVVGRKFSKVQALQNQDEATHGPVYLSEEDEQAEGERDAQRLPYSFRHSSLLGAARLDGQEGTAQNQSSQDGLRSEP